MTKCISPSLRSYTQREVEVLLNKEPDAYIAVLEVTAVRLDTFLSSSRLGTQLPLKCIDQGQAFVIDKALNGLTKPTAT